VYQEVACRYTCVLRHGVLVSRYTVKNNMLDKQPPHDAALKKSLCVFVLKMLKSVYSVLRAIVLLNEIQISGDK